MAASPEPWPDSALFAVSGIAGKVSENSHRETYPGRLASCVPMGSLATPMEFLRPTGLSVEPARFTIQVLYLAVATIKPNPPKDGQPRVLASSVTPSQ